MFLFGNIEVDGSNCKLFIILLQIAIEFELVVGITSRGSSSTAHNADNKSISETFWSSKFGSSGTSSLLTSCW